MQRLRCNAQVAITGTSDYSIGSLKAKEILTPVRGIQRGAAARPPPGDPRPAPRDGRRRLVGDRTADATAHARGHATRGRSRQGGRRGGRAGRAAAGRSGRLGGPGGRRARYTLSEQYEYRLQNYIKTSGHRLDMRVAAARQSRRAREHKSASLRPLRGRALCARRGMVYRAIDLARAAPPSMPPW